MAIKVIHRGVPTPVTYKGKCECCSSVLEAHEDDLRSRATAERDVPPEGGLRPAQGGGGEHAMSSEYVACETCGESRLHYYAYVQGVDKCPACLNPGTPPSPDSLIKYGVGDRVRLTTACRAYDVTTPGVVYSVHPGGVRVVWDDDTGRPSDPIPGDVLEPA